MGTNYYIRNNFCKTCNRYEELHLGKSSGGWDFSFQYNGGKYYQNFEEFKKFLRGKVILDEYGRKITKKEFFEMIENKKKTYGKAHLKYTDEKSFYIGDYNFADYEFS